MWFKMRYIQLHAPIFEKDSFTCFRSKNEMSGPCYPLVSGGATNDCYAAILASTTMIITLLGKILSMINIIHLIFVHKHRLINAL